MYNCKARGDEWTWPLEVPFLPSLCKPLRIAGDREQLKEAFCKDVQQDRGKQCSAEHMRERKAHKQAGFEGNIKGFVLRKV